LALHARLVLDDCRAALVELTDDLPYDVWRRRWFTVIAMLVTARDVVKMSMQMLIQACGGPITKYPVNFNRSRSGEIP
jgi:hypothetical protein